MDEKESEDLKKMIYFDKNPRLKTNLYELKAGPATICIIGGDNKRLIQKLFDNSNIIENYIYSETKLSLKNMKNKDITELNSLTNLFKNYNENNLRLLIHDMKEIKLDKDLKNIIINGKCYRIKMILNLYNINEEILPWLYETDLMIITNKLTEKEISMIYTYIMKRYYEKEEFIKIIKSLKRDDYILINRHIKGGGGSIGPVYLYKDCEIQELKCL